MEIFGGLWVDLVQYVKFEHHKFKLLGLGFADLRFWDVGL